MVACERTQNIPCRNSWLTLGLLWVKKRQWQIKCMRQIFTYKYKMIIKKRGKDTVLSHARTLVNYMEGIRVVKALWSNHNSTEHKQKPLRVTRVKIFSWEQTDSHHPTVSPHRPSLNTKTEAVASQQRKLVGTRRNAVTTYHQLNKWTSWNFWYNAMRRVQDPSAPA